MKVFLVKSIHNICNISIHSVSNTAHTLTHFDTSQTSLIVLLIRVRNLACSANLLTGLYILLALISSFFSFFLL